MSRNAGSATIAVVLLLCAPARSEESSNYWPTFSDELKSGGQGPLMIPIDGMRRFKMGCVTGIRCLFNEPVHEVTIQRPFAMSAYEITRAQFAQFVEQTGYVTDAERSDVPWPIGKKVIPINVRDKLARSKRSCQGVSADDVRAAPRNSHRTSYWDDHVRLWTWWNPGFEQSNEHPVVCISWTDAKEYVQWLAAETGRPYRLPSEAEWEYAARAGPLSMQNYGDPSSWCDHENPEPCENNYFRILHPVGGHGPNELGLYDIGIGVSEWTQDCWNRSFQGAPSDGSAWIAGDCSKRVIRDIANARVPPYHELRGPVGIHNASNSSGIRIAASPID